MTSGTKNKGQEKVSAHTRNRTDKKLTWWKDKIRIKDDTGYLTVSVD